MPMTAIALRNLSLSVGNRIVLDEITLSIENGEFIGVLGPNGAGKTTLMRAVLGLLSPRRGEIAVFGQAPTRGNPEIGYMPQARGAMASVRLSGWDYLARGIDGHRLGLPILGATARREVDRVLDLVGALRLARRPL